MQAKNDDDLDGGQRSSEVKWGKLCVVCYGYHIWSKEALMQAENDDDDLDGGQRSSEVNGVNYVLWLPYLVKRSTVTN